MPGLIMSQQTNKPLLLVSFSTNPQHVYTINQMRQAWIALPPMSIQEQVDDDAKLRATFEQVTTANRSPTEWLEKTKPNLDKTTNTPWRDLTYWYYNPVFVSALEFLLHSVGPHIGVCKDTSHLALPVPYPSRIGQPLQVTFDTNVFLVPAFIDSDTKIRIETVHPSQSICHTFDLQTEPYEVVWVQGGTAVEFFVEGGNPKMEDDLAGVFVQGVFVNSERGDDWSP